MKAVQFSLVLLLSVTVYYFFQISSPRQDNAGLSMVEILEKHGYPLESHSVQTADGYILTLHRIPHGLNRTTTPGSPILLQHGLGATSLEFVLLGPNKSLGFLLADAGYDVWMTNARGNKFSLKHVSYTRDNQQFWNYSWHEMGTFDLVAEIDYILNKTKRENMYYLGHSLGMTLIMVLLSTYPEYNNKMKVVLGIGPTVYVGNTTSVLFKFLSLVYAPIIVKGGPNEFIPYVRSIIGIIWPLCDTKLPTNFLCYYAYSLFGGPPDVAMSSLPEIFSNAASSCSAKAFVHYGQCMSSGEFKLYNYGPEKNRIIYGTDEPPPYDLQLVTAPVAIFYSDDDTVSSPKDIFKLTQILPNVVSLYRVPLSGYNHLDFACGKSNRNHLYKEILKTLDAF